eukprot:5156260-Amphidinium_carterae.1
MVQEHHYGDTLQQGLKPVALPSSEGVSNHSPGCSGLGHELIKPALKFASFSSIVLLGESGIGKTPLAHAIAMAFSAHYIEKENLDMRPQFKTGTNLDLFRGDVGDTATPYVFDDGSLAAQIPEVMKAFLDVGAENPLVKARYNAAGFLKHQLR